MNIILFSSFKSIPYLLQPLKQLKFPNFFDSLKKNLKNHYIGKHLNHLKSKSLFIRSIKIFNSAPVLREKAKVNYGVFSLPHIHKRCRGGEDSYFLSNNIIAIADGVGGWNKKGIDASKYSKRLCENIKIEHEKLTEINEKSAKFLLVNAAEKTKEIGSSTCCLILFNNDFKRFYSANIGDSGYMIIRIIENHWKIVFKSEEQLHDFNIPFQIGTNGDQPQKAITFSHEIENHDIIITATDGLWDNLEDSKILEILVKNLNGNRIFDTNIFAKELAITAENYSNDKNYVSPFAKKARNKKHSFTGGKPDDITVIVAQVDFEFGSRFKNHFEFL